MTTKRESVSDLTNVESSRRIDNNTYEIKYINGDRAIRLHLTNIIIFKSNGDTVLNSGGWRTATTKARINTFCNLSVYQERGIWYVGERTIFYDGITFDNLGRLLGSASKLDQKKIDKKLKSIKHYCAIIDKLEKVPEPSGGDCWHCFLRDKNGQTMGECFDNVDHLNQHLKDHYMHGSIIFKALESAGYQSPGVLIAVNARDSIKRALYKYLKKQLLPELAA